jgi:hypothetical protein
MRLWGESTKGQDRKGGEGKERRDIANNNPHSEALASPMLIVNI